MLRAARITAVVAAVSLGCAVVVAFPRDAAAATLTGTVRAPAAHDPALAVHAWSAASGKRYSTTVAPGQHTYSLDVPPGRYVVFAVPADPGAPPLYAGHTQFTLCARDRAHLEAGTCQDHALVEVEVAKKKVTGVDVTDWFLDGPAVATLARALDRPEDSWTEAELAAPKFTEYPAARFVRAVTGGAPATAAASAPGGSPGPTGAMSAAGSAGAVGSAGSTNSAGAASGSSGAPASGGPVSAPVPAPTPPAAPAASAGVAAPASLATPDPGITLSIADPADARFERDRPALVAALAAPPNFAGRFALVRVPCADGAPEGCAGTAIVDFASGRVAYPPALNPLPAAEPCLDRGVLQFRSDSRLLTLSGRDGDSLVTRYLVWNPDAQTLRVVASLASEFAERCASRQ